MAFCVLYSRKGHSKASKSFRKGVSERMCDFEEFDVISRYSRQQAVVDGVLVELFKNRWEELSGGRPILATSHLSAEVSLAGLREIWNEFATWRAEVMPNLPEEERLFVAHMNEK